MKFDFLNEMKAYLEKYGKLSSTAQAAIERQNGKALDLSVHVKYIVYALLTNQKKWSEIKPHLNAIDELFFHYNLQQVKSKPAEYFEQGIKRLKCGNMSIKAQMENLHSNIEKLEELDSLFKGWDQYVISHPVSYIIRLLSDSSSPYKFKQMGVSLICEYLKSIGVQCVKPDVHIVRFLSRRSLLSFTPRIKNNDVQLTSSQKITVIDIVSEISKYSGISMPDIDRIIWSFCATGYGEICNSEPKCTECPVRSGCPRIGV